MDITLNGTPHNVPDSISLHELLSRRQCDPLSVVVEQNREIVDKGDYETTFIHQGDSIEILHFVGGG